MNQKVNSSLIPHPSALVCAGVAQLVEHQPSKLRVASSSLVSRSTLLRVVVRGRKRAETRPRSSGVERLLGKEEVMSSNLIAGSIQTDDLHHITF
jgi:hypothetical protein